MENIQEMNDICKETLTVLAYCTTDIIEKIPSKILKTLTNLAADSKMNFYIEKEKDLDEQKISERTKDLIALLYYSYIANTDEKEELLKIWNENEEAFQKELREKYNPDNIFKKNVKQENTHEENNALIEYKESYFKKFKNFIFKILHVSK